MKNTISFHHSNKLNSKEFDEKLRRIRNNGAVQRSREKFKLEMEETMDRVSTLVSSYSLPTKPKIGHHSSSESSLKNTIRHHHHSHKLNSKEFDEKLRRIRNNEAVRRSREKSKLEMEKTMDRLNTLEEENLKLTFKLKQLSQTLNVLEDLKEIAERQAKSKMAKEREREGKRGEK